MVSPRGIGELVREFLKAGYTHADVVRALGCSKSTVAHHAKTLGVRKGGPRPKYNWRDVQAYYDVGHDLRECMQQFGFSRAAWSKAAWRGVIRPRDRGMPLGNLLSADRLTQRTHLKMRLLRAGLLSAECSECGLRTWRGQPLSLELDHVNGNKRDNRLENLRLLCPNCHSQTETYAGRNKRCLRHSVDKLRTYDCANSG